MSKVKSWTGGGLLTLLVMGLGGSALAAPGREVIDFDAVIAATDSSVLGNDGNADYTSRHPVATVENYAPGDHRGDSFSFSPYNAGRGRTISFQHPDIEGGTKVTCDAGNVSFGSDRAPSTWWEEVLEHGSTTGGAEIRCFPGGNMAYVASFAPFTEEAEKTEEVEEECVSFAKTSDTTFAISAEAYLPESTSDSGSGGSGGSGGPTGIEPIDDLLGGGEEEPPDEEPEVTPASGCPATIYVYRWEKGDWAVQSSVPEASAAFLLELPIRQ